MELSLELILSELKLNVVMQPAVAGRRFTSVEMFVIGTAPPPDVLEVCLLSEALNAHDTGGACFICVRDRMPDEFESPESLANIIIVRKNIGIRDLFNRIQRVFVKINGWVLDMERSTAAHEGLQELLHLSEPIFNNLITVQDDTFKLLAYTKDVPPTDDIMRRLIQNGYHPPETIELFRKARRIEQYKTITDITVSRDRLTSDFDVVKKSFSADGSLFIIVVMVCSSKPADDGVIELFGLLINYIKRYSDREIGSNGGNSGIRKLALDLLTGNISSKEEAAARAAYCSYQFSKSFRMLVFSFSDEANTMLTHIVKQLRSAFPACPIFTFKSNVLLLQPSGSDVSSLCRAAGEVLGDLSFLCGISDVIDSMWLLPSAYAQAVIAVDTAKRRRHSGDMGSFLSFSDAFIYEIISKGVAASPTAYTRSEIMTVPERLREYDRRHRTNTAEITRVYLENERRATCAAEVLHMHRNTILHHMENIEEYLGLSFDDADTRLKLLLSFRADELEGLVPGETDGSGLFSQREE